MPSLQISTSGNISLLATKVVADLCAGNFLIDLSPSIFIGSGTNNVLGARVRATNPLGIVIKDFASTGYDIAPPMTGVVTVAIPTQSNNFQYGKYIIYIQLIDSDNTVYSLLPSTVTICPPNVNDKTKKYGTLSALLNGICKDGKLYVIVDNAPTYNGVLSFSQDNDLSLSYPTISGLPVLDTAQSNFSVALFEGVYLITGTVCASYSFSDNVFVNVPYKVKREKEIRCLIDGTCIAPALQYLNNSLNTACSEKEREEITAKIIQALFLIQTIESSVDAGSDASDLVVELEGVLGCACTCNCADGTPIGNTNPSGDIVITGRNTSSTVSGLTTTYLIDNDIYVVSVTDNGGVLTITDATLDGVTQTQVINFDLDILYNQIKGEISNITEYTFFANVIKLALAGLDVSCLGITTDQFNALSFKDFIQLLISSICNGGYCNATVSNIVTTQSGNDVSVAWTDDVNVYEANVYVDNILQATVLSPTAVFLLKGFADGATHTYEIVAICGNGSKGNTITGTFTYSNPVYNATFKIGSSLMALSDIHPQAPAYENGTPGTVYTPSNSSVNLTLDLYYYPGSSMVSVLNSYTFPSGLIVDSNLVVNSKWVVNAHYDGTANRTFVIVPPVVSVFSFRDQGLLPNSSLQPVAPAFVGVDGSGSVYSSLAATYVTFEVPYTNLGGTPDFITTHTIPAGLIIDSATVYGSQWVVSAHYDGTIPHTFFINEPVYVNVFQLNGTTINNSTVNILTAGIRFETANSGMYNYGYSGYITGSVQLRFNQIPNVTGTFANDWVLPSGVILDSVTVSGSYYILTIHYAHTGNHIFNIITKPSS